MNEREGGTPYSVDSQRFAIAKAGRWTAEQAERLSTSPAVILDAIKRGWLPDQIEGVESKYRLEGVPLCPEIREGVERIQRAPVKPVPKPDWMVRRTREPVRLCRTSGREGPTVMETAMEKARAT